MTTFKGRVVYERPVHMFTAKDIARVSKKVFSTANWNESSTIIETLITDYLVDHEATVLTAIYLWIVVAKVFMKYLKMDVDSLRDLADELRKEIAFGEAVPPEDYLV